MFICENCEVEHNGEYSSGRFCSVKCAKSFSTKNNRKQINIKISNKLKRNFCVIYPIQCKYCGQWNIKRQKGKKYCNNSCANRDRKITEETRLKISNRLKREYANGRKVYGGNNHVPWYEYKDMKIQGTYELRFCKILDDWLKLGYIKSWGYTNDRVPYIGLDNKDHTYLIDFEIKNNQNKKEYFEVKGRTDETTFIKLNAVPEKIHLIRLNDIEKFEKFVLEGK